MSLLLLYSPTDYRVHVRRVIQLLTRLVFLLQGFLLPAVDQ